jgi:hypothetical protein
MWDAYLIRLTQLKNDPVWRSYAASWGIQYHLYAPEELKPMLPMEADNYIPLIIERHRDYTNCFVVYMYTYSTI